MWLAGGGGKVAINGKQTATNNKYIAHWRDINPRAVLLSVCGENESLMMLSDQWLAASSKEFWEKKGVFRNFVICSVWLLHSFFAWPKIFRHERQCEYEPANNIQTPVYQKINLHENKFASNKLFLAIIYYGPQKASCWAEQCNAEPC